MSKPSSHASTLYDHVRELQFRLLASVAVLLVGGVVGYIFYNPIFQLLRTPLHAPLFYSSPAGSFLFVMKISLLVAVAIALPVIIYNLIMFMRPAFKEKLSRTRVYLTTLGSIVLAAAGAGFAFYVILPASIKFFVGFQVSGLSALIDASTYLTFVINILISFILVFQLPLVIFFIDHIKPIPPKKLLKMEKWVIIGGLLVGVIAPFSFDPTTEFLIAAPIIVLFNLSIVMIALQHAHKRSVTKAADRRAHKKTIREAKVAASKPEDNQPLLPRPQVATRVSSTLATSIIEPASHKAPIAPISPIHPANKVIKQDQPISVAKKWMDVSPTQSVTHSPQRATRTAKLSPAPLRPQQANTTIPARTMDYSRQRYISDIL